jgi:hypothetical protein
MKFKELERKEKTEIQIQKAKKPPGGQGGFLLETCSLLSMSWSHYNRAP